MPQPAKPIERKRKTGNPGKRALPAQVIVAEQVKEEPAPLRNLGPAGLATWSRIWAAGAYWLSGKTDIQIVQMLCECEDERYLLRVRLWEQNDWHDRNALRALEASMMSIYSLLGFTPVDRGKMGFGEVRSGSVLDELRAKREQRTGQA